MLKRSFSIMFDVLWSWDHVLSIFRVSNFADVDFFGPVPQRFLTKASSLGMWILPDFRLVILPGPTGTVCVIWIRCVVYLVVTERSVRSCWTLRCHKTDCMILFIFLNWWFGIVWTPSGSHKWLNLPNSHTFLSVRSLGWVCGVEFTCGAMTMEIL